MHPALRLFATALAGLAVYFVVLLSIVHAQEACMPLEQTKARALARGASFAEVLDKSAIAAFVALYNAQPPVSDEKYEHAYLILPEGGNVTIVALGNGDTTCRLMPIPSAILQKLMDRVLGTTL